MNKNAKTNKSSNGPGRPAYQIKWPTGKFTFQDLEILNGVDPETGKGKVCTKLTLRKGLARDLALNSKSLIVKTKETRAPDSESGLGRKSFVFIRRSKLQATKAKKSAKAAEVLAPVVTIAPVETPVETVAVEAPVETPVETTATIPEPVAS
jgi:hypothetical protein